MQGRNKRTVVGVVLLVCLVGLVFAIDQMSQVASHPPPPLPPTSRVDQYWSAILSVTPAAPRGVKNAAYSLVEFGDFQCPHCGDARKVVEQTVDQSGGKVNLYFVQTPFPMHEFAEPAAEAALFAAKHGKFWEMYDVLYDHQKALQPANYAAYARQVGLDGAALTRAVTTHQFAEAVARSGSLAEYLGVQETPLLALRDNRAGRFVWAVQGEKDVKKQLAKSNWTAPMQTAIGPSPEKT